MDFGQSAREGTIQEPLEIPAAGLGCGTALGEIDAGILQPDGGQFQPAPEERKQTGYRFEGSNVRDWLRAERWIVVNNHAFYGKARTGKQIEMHIADPPSAPARFGARRESL